MRHLLFAALLLMPLLARENPFKPLIDETVLPVTSNKVEKAPPFEEVKVQLPVDARVLTSVAIYYQSIDGSIKKEIVAIDRSVDWHKPIVISQKGTGNGEWGTGEAKAKPAAKTKAPVKKAAAKKKAKSAKRTTKREAQKTVTPEYFKGEKVFQPLPFVAVKFGKNYVRIVTDDEKLRVFHLSDPFKIALDLKRKAAFLTKHKSLSTPPYKAVDIGNHDGYYRVVITFDAPYRYTVSKVADGYIIHLR
ncbi:AMIN domain-containing protein [Hydrogenimonas sp.]